MIGRIFGINRIRMGIDGPGITTLVGMYKCPLICEYCINNPILSYTEYTIDELYNDVKVDALYFDFTDGGICFGGHEPLLQQPFIKKFIQYVKTKGHKWKIGIETSLNCELDFELISLLDFLIADVKTINSEIYKKYTERDNKLVLENLRLIKDKVPNIQLRLPIIPEYNDENDIESSKEYLRNLGYKDEQFDVFKYKTEL